MSARLGKKWREKGSERVHLHRDTSLPRRLCQTRRQPRAERREVAIEARFQLIQAPDARRHGERIARQGAGLIDRSGRRHEIHEIAAAAVPTDWQAPTPDLSPPPRITFD